MSRESSQEASRELSRVESDSREFTETSSDGTIRTAIMLTNGGNTTFSVNGLSVLVSQVPKQALGTTLQPRSTTIATLRPVFNSTTLAPGETAGPFELAATGVNAQSIKALLAAPDTLMLGTASMDLTDSNGLDFDYVRQFTAAQTAHLIIDFGDGDVRQYNVATNVDRNTDGSFRGITLSRVLDDHLGFRMDDPVGGFKTRTGANGRSALDSLLNHSYRESGGVRTAYWDMVVVKRNQSEQKNPDFNNVVLQAGDYVHLMYQEVAGQSGVTTTVARASGIDQFAPVQNGDADGDGLSNQEEILQGWVAFANLGDTAIVYDELRRLAAQRMTCEKSGQTLQATALVHEAFLRLVGDQDSPAPNWNSRGHFFAAAAEAMRRILIDRARAKQSQKRGGGRKKLALDSLPLTIDSMSDEIIDEIIDLDDALTKLAIEDRVGSELVKLCYFGGLSLKDAARMLNIPATTASRYWSYARAWLYHEMSGDDAACGE